MSRRGKRRGNDQSGMQGVTPPSPTMPTQAGSPSPAFAQSPTTRDLDRELKELEVLNKTLELDATRKESEQKYNWSARWNNPVALAILAALVGYLGTMITWTLARSDEQARHARTLELEEARYRATEQLEQKKLQGTLILDAMKTGDEERAAANLLLLADAKLIIIDDDTRESLEKWRGEVGPGLPSPVQTEPDTEVDKDNFRATYRRGARTSVADGPLVSYEDMDELLNNLPKDEVMQRHDPPIGNSSGRVTEENQNVSVKVCFLYAFKVEASNDFHLILGSNESGQDTRFLSAFISGLPSGGQFRDQLQVPRTQFRKVFGEPPKGYRRLDPPIRVRVTGSLYYAASHRPGVVGPAGLAPETAWRIQPITEIVIGP